MKTLPKVKVSDLTEKHLDRLREITVAKIAAYRVAHPKATAMDIIIKLKIAPAFFANNIYCFSCGYSEPMASYAIAQKAMGHQIIFTCNCGNKIKC